MDLVIEYCLGRKNPADGPFRCPDYIVSDDNLEQTLYTVEYMTRSLVKADKTVQENGEIHQALPASEATSEPNYVLESQLAKTKNP